MIKETSQLFSSGFKEILAILLTDSANPIFSESTNKFFVSTLVSLDKSLLAEIENLSQLKSLVPFSQN
jgi:hypothetical protein